MAKGETAHFELSAADASKGVYMCGGVKRCCMKTNLSVTITRVVKDLSVQTCLRIQIDAVLQKFLENVYV